MSKKTGMHPALLTRSSNKPAQFPYHLDALLVTQVFLFWNLFVLEFLLGISRDLSALLVKTFRLLDALQLLMFVRALPYLETKLIFLTHFITVLSNY
jgi:hypothetical protein